MQGIYLIVNKEDIVLYVGQSSDVERRLGDHHFGFGNNVLVIPTVGEDRRMKLEAKLINKLSPVFNGCISFPIKKTTVEQVLKTFSPNEPHNTTYSFGTGRKYCEVCNTVLRSNNITGICRKHQRHGSAYVQKLKMRYELSNAEIETKTGSKYGLQ